MVFATNSILVAMVQQCAPTNAGFVSSLPGGFSWGVAGLTMPLFGLMADIYSVQGVMRIMALLPLVAAVVGIFLPQWVTPSRNVQNSGPEVTGG